MKPAALSVAWIHREVWLGRQLRARLGIAATTVLFLFLICARATHAQGEPKYVNNVSSQGDFVLAASGQAATLVVSGEDWPGVARAVGDLSQDGGRGRGHDARVVE